MLILYCGMQWIKYQLVTGCKQLNLDVIVADITMPSLDGIDTVEQPKKTGSRAKVVFLTMHHGAIYANRAFEAGASDFVLKHSAPDEQITSNHCNLHFHKENLMLSSRYVFALAQRNNTNTKQQLNKATARQTNIVYTCSCVLPTK